MNVKADRRVTESGKDPDGDITALCGTWGRREKAGAVSDINSGTHSYYTYSAGQRANVRVHACNIGSSERY